MLPGALLKDRYRVIKKIGEGGEGEIFGAWDEELQRDVAIKCQPSRSFVSTGMYASEGLFIDEEHNRLKAVVDIPGIPQVFDRGTYGKNDRKFLVMELVKGATIASWIQWHHPIPKAAAVSIIGQLCKILARLHAKNYVHRDVTPNNAMLQPDGRVRLLDVGISVSAGESNKDPRGTNGYAAPEQHDSDAVLTPQADVFALGALLFKMVVSELPYCGLEHPLDAASPAFPENFGAEMCDELRSLGLAMVAIDPRERPNGVAEVLCHLQPMLPTPGSPASPKATRPDPTTPYRLGLMRP